MLRGERLTESVDGFLFPPALDADAIGSEVNRHDCLQKDEAR